MTPILGGGLPAITANTTLLVPSQYANIGAAMTYLQGFRIAAGATVTIQVADGTYSLGTASYTLNHIDGLNIQLLGNVTTPASCALNFTSSAFHTAFLISYGHGFGFIDGFVITAASLADTQIGIYVIGNSYLRIGSHMTLANWYCGIAAHQGAYIWVDGTVGSYVTVTGGGDGNVWAYDRSGIVCPYIHSTTAGTYSAKAGLLCEHTSCIWADHAVLTSNAGCGVAISYGSSVYCQNSTFTSNPIGIHFFGGSNAVDDTGSTFSGTTYQISPEEGAVYRTKYYFYPGTGGFTPTEITNSGTAQWRGFTAAAYDGMSFTQKSSTGVGFQSTANSAGHDIAIIVCSPSQTIRNVYGLGTGERAEITANGYTDFTIGCYDAKPLYFGTNNVARWQINSSGHTLPVATNTYDIGSSSFTIRNVTAAGFINGKLQTSTAATTGLTAGVLAATTNATIVLYDSTGQAYRVPCIV